MCEKEKLVVYFLKIILTAILNCSNFVLHCLKILLIELYRKMRKSLSENRTSHNRDEMLLERLSRKSVDCVNVYLLFMNLFFFFGVPLELCVTNVLVKFSQRKYILSQYYKFRPARQLLMIVLFRAFPIATVRRELAWNLMSYMELEYINYHAWSFI